MRRTILVALFCVAVCVSSTFAWGAVGHAVVGNIAQSLISPTTWNKIQAIQGQGVSLASVASQPDAYDHSAAGKWSSPLHYVNMPQGSTHFSDSTADCPNQFCVVGAIKNYTVQAQKLPLTLWPYSGDSSLPSAITFLVHFIGDIHQPLHVGWKEDKGGNSIKVKFFGKDTNLHSLWDSGMIYKSGYDVVSLSSKLSTYISSNPTVVDGWRTTTSTSAWAEESFQYVLSNCYNWGTAGQNALGQAYFDKNWPVVQMRLAAAGVRLAALLDSIYGH